MKKIAIVDTDCHHGDGTQDIYWNDPNVLYISIHQDGRTLYPGSGHVDEIGGPNALGKTINIPLPPETSDEGFLYAIDEMVLPILKDFKPEIIVNSAGQDNHYTDPITNMNFSAQGYAMLNEKLNPDIAVLEGGYSIQGALPYVNLGIILAMAGVDYSHVQGAGLQRGVPATGPADHRVHQEAQGRRPGRLLQSAAHEDLPAYGECMTRKKNIYLRHGRHTGDADRIDHTVQGMLRPLQPGDVFNGLLAVARDRNPHGRLQVVREGGVKLLNSAKKSGKYCTIQVIDRVKKEYYRV